MDFILLTHFDNVLGPNPFLRVPLHPKEGEPVLPATLQRDIASLMDTITTEGFFSHSLKEINSANYFLELNSKWGRGGKELLCITILTKVKNPQIYKDALENFANKIKKIPELYKAFYENSKPGEKDIANKKDALVISMREFAIMIAKMKEEATAGKILVLGLEQAGKTSLMHRLSNGNFSQGEKPTLGVNIIKIVLSEVELLVYDCGGQKAYRDKWVTTVSTPHALVFVIDLSDEDPARQKEALEEFWRVLNHFGDQKLEQFPVLVIGNKVDLVKKPNEKDLAKLLNLKKLKDRPVHIGLTSARTGSGVEESFKWLVTQLISAY